MSGQGWAVSKFLPYARCRTKCFASREKTKSLSGWQIFLYRAVSRKSLVKVEQRATLHSRASLSTKDGRSGLRVG